MCGVSFDGGPPTTTHTPSMGRIKLQRKGGKFNRDELPHAMSAHEGFSNHSSRSMTISKRSVPERRILITTLWRYSLTISE